MKSARFGSEAASSKPSAKHQDTPPEDYSVWRNTALRYGGYADEVGEFMVPYTGALGKFLGYLVSGLYCVADMGTSLTSKFRNASPELTTAQKTRKTAAEGLDLSFFHVIATLLIPPKLIGAVVETASHILDREALAHAREAAQSAPPSKGLFSWISKKKLDFETAMNQRLAPHVERFLAKKQAENGFLIQKTEAASNWLLNKHGSKLAPFVEGTAKLADQYNHWMPISYFRDAEIGNKLRENVKFLKDANRSLTREQITKLAWIKPIPVLVGIAMIPLIAHPFDKLMIKIQNWTTRPLLGKNKIKVENGELVSVQNPEFWGKHPKIPKRIKKRHHQIATFAGHHIVQAHYQRRQQAAHFGTMAFNQTPYRPYSSPIANFTQPANPFARPVYPSGDRGFYC